MDKKSYQIVTPGGTRTTFDTLESVKQQPDAKEISVFDENLQEYIGVCHKVDGVWLNEGQQSLYS